MDANSYKYMKEKEPLFFVFAMMQLELTIRKESI